MSSDPPHGRWPEYGGLECLFHPKRRGIGVLFYRPVEEVPRMRRTEGGLVLSFEARTIKKLPITFRYTIDPATFQPSAVEVVTADAGSNPSQFEKQETYHSHNRSFTPEDERLLREWSPPKGARLRTGRKSIIDIERQAEESKDR